MTTHLSILVFLSITFSAFTSKKDQKKITAPTPVQQTIDRDSIIQFALNYRGVPYVYAGNNPSKGFDCSGFVYYVFKSFNIELPRSSGGYKNIGKALDPTDFRIGDILIFYGYKDKSVIGHVGIICEAKGLDSKFIHASSGKAGSVTISELNSDHYSKRFYKGITVLPD
jgi:cell wall-associated NlpC family hydrolase